MDVQRCLHSSLHGSHVIVFFRSFKTNAWFHLWLFAALIHPIPFYNFGRLLYALYDYLDTSDMTQRNGTTAVEKSKNITSEESIEGSGMNGSIAPSQWSKKDRSYGPGKFQKPIQNVAPQQLLSFDGPSLTPSWQEHDDLLSSPCQSKQWGAAAVSKADLHAGMVVYVGMDFLIPAVGTWRKKTQKWLGALIGMHIYHHVNPKRSRFHSPCTKRPQGKPMVDSSLIEIEPYWTFISGFCWSSLDGTAVAWLLDALGHVAMKGTIPAPLTWRHPLGWVAWPPWSVSHSPGDFI